MSDFTQPMFFKCLKNKVAEIGNSTPGSLLTNQIQFTSAVRFALPAGPEGGGAFPVPVVGSTVALTGFAAPQTPLLPAIEQTVTTRPLRLYRSGLVFKLKFQVLRMETCSVFLIKNPSMKTCWTQALTRLVGLLTKRQRSTSQPRTKENCNLKVGRRLKYGDVKVEVEKSGHQAEK